MCDVITCPRPWYLLLAHKFSYSYEKLYIVDFVQAAVILEWLMSNNSGNFLNIPNIMYQCKKNQVIDHITFVWYRLF